MTWNHQFCVICGAAWEDGEGFTEEHYFPCANEQYGWAFTREVPLDWERPAPPDPSEFMVGLSD